MTTLEQADGNLPASVSPGAENEPKPAAVAPAVEPLAPAQPKPQAAPAAPAAKPKPKPKPAPANKPTPGPEAAKPQSATEPPRPAGPSAADIARRVRKTRARRLAIALACWVGLPTLIGALYYGLLAANQYESVTTLMVLQEGEHGAVAANLFKEHVLSRDTLAAIERSGRFRAHYSGAHDPWARLSPKAGTETRFAYYLDHVTVRYDSSTRVLTLKVRAFSGSEARGIARDVLAEGQRFVAETVPHAETLLVIAQPSAPDESTFPNRGYGMLTVFLSALALFAIGSLLIAAVREHAQF